ncbi:hypothetical protein HanIR_Chr13g0668751 [Helianthus annuus]|nr:hypothetical protein HanIR_Chr13g0668751 [Helianthus annuus]
MEVDMELNWVGIHKGMGCNYDPFNNNDTDNSLIRVSRVYRVSN